MGVVSSKEEEEAAAEEDMASGDTVKLRVEGRCSCRCDSDRSDPNVLVRRRGRGGGCRRVNNNDTEKAPVANGVGSSSNNQDDTVNSGRRNDKNDDERVDHIIVIHSHKDRYGGLAHRTSQCCCVGTGESWYVQERLTLGLGTGPRSKIRIGQYRVLK